MIYYKLVKNKKLTLYISARVGDLVYDNKGNIYEVGYKKGKIVFNFILPSVLVATEDISNLTDKQYNLFFNISKNGITSKRKKR